MTTAKSIIIQLTVNNHPGVMLHITGLFSRRAFNLEGILCTSNPDDRSRSTMLLLVDADGRLDQMVQQLGKLYDVLDLSIREEGDGGEFGRLYEFLQDPHSVQPGRSRSTAE
jgi:acetolactate synthase-1/3 small subunit